MTTSARRLSTATMASYGFGAVAYGVKDSGFGTFLLLFYNQVVGLPSATVGLVIMMALLIDAFVDPAVGFFSDRTRTRWGRRHPWMYASALPIMIGWLLLWNPPAMLSQPQTLVWLFAMAVLVRSAVSCYEVPSVALTPELSSGYDERTRIMAYRYLFGWVGGLLMLLSAYQYFLSPTAAFPNGLLNRAGYAGFALAGAVAIGIAILVSALGTHHEIRHLPNPPIARQTLRESFAELRHTVKNRAFVILMAAGVCAYTIQGISYAMSNYLYTYVWGFKGPVFVYLTLALFSGVFLAFLAAPRLGRTGSKPRVALAAVLLGATLNTAPYWLRMLGMFPEVGDRALLPILFALFILGTASNVTGFILGASMMADVVEDSEAKTGRRSEGVFFAGSFFVQKCTSGIGIFFAGMILAVAGFPAKATPGTVPVATIDRLTLIYAGLYVALACVSAYFFARFPFGRVEHEARLARLATKPT
ncbi:Sodium:melibiose symporter [Sphingomonas aurantiaca]|uniref:Sodium:melibiose symporter n=1 Tax=Sphingomonas aurantiaca TaxID=185949 RepID=A0A5E8A8G4_9SPHN|nr:MFS transporter [Sphingomonas aurantiaca]VVT25782.1 Sodium:melibiose symporter [Sphingomonas aurantiaca]